MFKEQMAKDLKLNKFDTEYVNIHLFGPANDWPEPFRKDFLEAEDPKDQAKVAFARVEYFIQTGQ